MAIRRIAAKLASRRSAGRGARKAMSSKQKAALKKAQAVSARKRRGKGKPLAPGRTRTGGLRADPNRGLRGIRFDGRNVAKNLASRTGELAANRLAVSVMRVGRRRNSKRMGSLAMGIQAISTGRAVSRTFRNTRDDFGTIRDAFRRGRDIRRARRK